MKPRIGSRLLVEYLEDRCCPAISATLSGGTLTVSGSVTTPGDLEKIQQTANGEFKVFDGATQVNGTFTGVTHLKVTTTNAADKVEIDLGGFTISGNVTVKLCNGTNDLTIHDGTIGGALSITGGSNVDTVTLTNIDVTADSSIHLDGGPDDILTVTDGDFTVNLTLTHINEITFDANSSVGKSAKINGGNGKNEITWDGDVGSDLRFAVGYLIGNKVGKSTLTLGSTANVGRDLVFASALLNVFGSELSVAGTVVRDVLYYGTNHGDSVDITGSIGRNLSVDARDGADLVTVGSAAVIGGKSSFYLGCGDDTLTFSGKTGAGAGTTALFIAADGGKDTVSITSTANVNGNASISMGSGDDLFILDDAATLLAGSSMTVNGGSGSDTYKGTRPRTGVTDANFEIFI